MLNRRSKKTEGGTEGCGELRARALCLLARREHTRREITEKLNPHAQDAADIETVLDELTEEGLLSDARTAQAILNSRIGRQGPLKIRQALQKHGVPMTYWLKPFRPLGPANCKRRVLYGVKNLMNAPLAPKNKPDRAVICKTAASHRPLFAKSSKAMPNRMIKH